MPIDEPILDEILSETVTASAIEIATAANRLQMELDGFMLSQGVRLSEEGLRAIIFGGDSSVAQGAMQSFRRTVLKVLDGSISRGFGIAVEERLRRDTSADELWYWRTQSGKPCPDCLARSHYSPRTLDDWSAIGNPQSGVTICGSNCMCTFKPAKETK